MNITLNKEASRFGEAFAIGNGHMGAMVYGGMKTDRLDLSENTFFSGNKSEEDNQAGASEAFYKMREQTAAGDYAAALETSHEFYGKRGNYGTNLPVGQILITRMDELSETSGYERSLDLENGIASSRYMQNGEQVSRQAFASHPHNVIVYEAVCDKNDMNLCISFQSLRDGEYVKYHIGGIFFVCEAHETMHSDGTTGTLLCGKVSIHTDGFPEAKEDGVYIKRASRVSLYITAITDFKEEVLEKEKQVLQLQMKMNRTFVKVDELAVEEILEAHRQDMQALYSRVTLNIGNQPLVNRMFQMGRYLLYSSSREDSLLPAHLQGIWNDNVACRIGWTCDMHLDINTQMNYWPSEVTNLPETAVPLFRWIREDLVPAGRKTAAESYGLKGWVGELVSNSWGYAAPYWASPLSPCPTGGVWTITQMWEHFLTSQDKKFLKEEAFPVIEEAVVFFSGYLFEDKESGYLTCGPSISPENSFVVDGKTYQISNGCTVEILMIRELFDIYQKACRVLRRKNKRMKDTADKAARLLPYRITGNGQIAEWNHDYPAADLQHRHTSHLLGLFPFAQITPENEKLAKAAEAVITAKLTPEENWEDTGWARSMLMLYEARLRHPQKALGHIDSMLTNLLEPNGFIIHPPTRGAGSFDNVYELDGNTGLTSCIAEMLMQSHGGIIRILPCLPEQWSKGEVKGLCARGGVTVDISWDENSCQVNFGSERSRRITIQYGEIRKTILLKEGNTSVCMK